MGADLVEQLGGGGEALAGPGLVTRVAQRLTQQRADGRDLVGNVEFLPRLHCLAGGWYGAAGVIPARARGDHASTARWRATMGVANAAAVAVQFGHALLGGVEVAGGDGHVHVHRKQRRRASACGLVAQTAGDDRPWPRRRDPGRAAVAPVRHTAGRTVLRFGERLLGPVQLTEPAADVAHLGVGVARRAVVTRGEFFARPGRFNLGFGERTAPLQHDGSVDAAHAGENGERMLLRPLQRGLGPLRGPLEVTDLFARADEAAIDLAGRERSEPALDGEQHRLVEMGHPFGDVASVDQYPPGAWRASASRLADRSLRPSVTTLEVGAERARRSRRPHASPPPRGAGGCRTRRSCRRRRAPAGRGAAMRRRWPGASANMLCSHNHTAHWPARRCSPDHRRRGTPPRERRCIPRAGRATTPLRRRGRHARPPARVVDRGRSSGVERARPVVPRHRVASLGQRVPGVHRGVQRYPAAAKAAPDVLEHGAQLARPG